jgi:hypothetical protein
MVLLLTVAAGRVVTADDASYTLEARAMAPIAQALERMKPLLQFTDVAIDRDAVTAHLCSQQAAEHRCFVLRLEYPTSDCQNRWGPFCASFPEGAPSAALTAVIANSLRTSTDMDVWTRLVPSTPAESLVTAPAAFPEEDRGGLASVVGIALALTIAPLVTGWGLAAFWRRRRERRQAGFLFAAAAIVIPAAGAVALDVALLLFGVWDALLVGLLVGAGLLASLHRAFADWKKVALLVGSCIGGLFALELGSRWLLPPPPIFPAWNRPILFLSDLMTVAPARIYSTTYAGLLTCQVIYGGSGPEGGSWASAVPSSWRPRHNGEKRILHLGDSMV